MKTQPFYYVSTVYEDDEHTILHHVDGVTLFSDKSDAVALFDNIVNSEKSYYEMSPNIFSFKQRTNDVCEVWQRNTRLLRTILISTMLAKV